jgi:flagellar hook-length control protein FliK
MMSAKTVFSDAAAVLSAPSTNPSTAAAPGSTPADFQNLLAGAVALPAPGLLETLPAPTLPQLLLVKNPAPAVKTPGAPSTEGLPSDVSPADMLKILDDAATLLPVTGDGETEVKVEIPEDLIDADELAKTDEEVISEWLEMMVPASVFAAQAGSGGAGDASQPQGGGAENKAGAAVPASLMRQALVPDQLMPVDVAPPGTTATNPGAVAKGELLANAVAQNPATAFAAALAGGKTEATEKDKPSADGWMSALGDLSAKRAHDVAPTAGPRLSTPVHDARWADALAHRLVMMARDGESTASLKLVPVDLGPLDIQISVKDGEASVHFGAAHQETRAVLEASLPRLRELLGAQGLQLSNASVSHQSGGQNRSEKSSGPAAIGAVAEDTEVATAKAVSTSLLDIYA